MLDIMIQGGSIPDYEKKVFIQGDVGIQDGKIVAVGAVTESAKKVIHAKGKVVSAGFIDIHMHEEDFLNEGKKYLIANRMLQMGVTTCLGGNCGVQNQPLEVFKNTIEELGGAPVNYLMQTGYNEFRTKMGLGRYEVASQEQINELFDIIKKEVAQGAIGVSFGLEYDPGISTEEVLQVLQKLNDTNLYASAHYRTDTITGLDSVYEMIKIADESGMTFQISHLSSCSAMGQMQESLDIINAAIERNPKINYDTYPYSAFCTTIGSAVFEDGCFEEWGKSYENVLVTSGKYQNQFCTKEIFEELRETEPELLVVAFVMNEEEIGQAIANPYGMIGSDGIVQNGNGHPRCAGTFPRVLGKYVREDKVVSLLDALRKMTLEPAKRLGLQNKGQIAVGMDADITIFDPDTILDGATFEDPSIKPVGIDYVLVSGGVALDHTVIQNDRLGCFIANPKA